MPASTESAIGNGLHSKISFTGSFNTGEEFLGRNSDIREFYWSGQAVVAHAVGCIRCVAGSRRGGQLLAVGGVGDGRDDAETFVEASISKAQNYLCVKVKILPLLLTAKFEPIETNSNFKEIQENLRNSLHMW